MSDIKNDNGKGSIWVGCGGVPHAIEIVRGKDCYGKI